METVTFWNERVNLNLLFTLQQELLSNLHNGAADGIFSSQTRGTDSIRSSAYAGFQCLYLVFLLVQWIFSDAQKHGGPEELFIVLGTIRETRLFLGGLELQELRMIIILRIRLLKLLLSQHDKNHEKHLCLWGKV